MLWLRLRRTRRAEADATWGCGYLAPTSSMQYTSSSFAQMLVGIVRLGASPADRIEPEDLPLFPRQADFHSEVPDAVLDEAVLPTFRFGGVAVLLVPGVPAGKHPDLPAVYLPRPDRAVALALGETSVETIVHNAVHILVALGLPPLLLGVIAKTKALFAGRVGPPVLQPYYDLIKLFQKGSVFSTTTTWVFRAGPVVGLVTAGIAVLLVPLANSTAPISFTGD